MSTLEERIDALYQGPLGEFTAARNALAKTLSRTEAARVRKLRKPTAVPWAINQLYWKARPTWDRLLRSGEQLRAAQLSALRGSPADIRAAAEAHRRAVSDAVRAAERAAAQSGPAPPVTPLMRAIEALSVLRGGPAPAGRLTDAPQPAGFEALTGVPIRGPATVVRLKPDTTAGTSISLPTAETDRRQAAAARKQEAAAKRNAAAETKRAAAAARKAAAAARKKEAAIRKAEAAVAAARAKLERLKSG